jgi:hypothetical protein
MAEFFADFFLGLVADFVVGLYARLRRRRKAARGGVTKAHRPRASQNFRCDCRQTNNAAGLK